MILTGESRQKFLRDNHIICSRKNFNVLYFEVKAELIFSLTDNLFMSIRSIILLITNHQFYNTCFTNGRDIRKLIDCCCFQQSSTEVESSKQTSSVGRLIAFSGGVTITLGSAKKYLERDLPSRITTYPSLAKSSSGL